MPIEHAIRLGVMSFGELEGTGGLKAALDRFSWFYLGAEFCENLLTENICGDIARFQEKGGKVCFMTPPLSEKGTSRLKKIFSALRALEKAGKLDFSRLELSVNDFAALELARDCGLAVRISAGRIFYENVFTQNRGHLHALSRQALEVFRSLGLARYDISIPGKFPLSNFAGKSYGLGKLDFNFSLHYPYLNLTTTRTCMVGMPDIRPHQSVDGINCSYECRACAFQVAHPWIREDLLVRGNTIFLKLRGKGCSSVKELKGLRVDRLVYAPFP